MKIKSFAFIGGDRRQLYAAQSMQSEGYKIYVCGFDKPCGDWSFESVSADEAIKNADCIVLPIPLTRDGSTINAPYSTEPIKLDDKLAASFSDKRVFCSMKNKLLSLSQQWKQVRLYDYFAREELAVENAVASAEGAIEVAMREYEGTIHGSKCLVAGFGRIGKVLSKMLDGLGADVITAARKKQDMSMIYALGYKPVDIKNLCDLRDIDIVFNTVPALIFGAHTLALACKNAIVIDLASAPGGVDFDSAQRLGIKAIHALSLPGKVAPKTSGEIIKNTIFNMLEED